jgi:hypothetical protein
LIELGFSFSCANATETSLTSAMRIWRTCMVPLGTSRNSSLSDWCSLCPFCTFTAPSSRNQYFLDNKQPQPQSTTELQTQPTTEPPTRAFDCKLFVSYFTPDLYSFSFRCREFCSNPFLESFFWKASSSKWVSEDSSSKLCADRLLGSVSLPKRQAHVRRSLRSMRIIYASQLKIRPAPLCLSLLWQWDLVLRPSSESTTPSPYDEVGIFSHPLS